MEISLRQMQFIVALADTGRFVDAARRCAVSQPAMSKQIREVESLLGVQLFERTRPAVIVTARGRAVVDRARGILAEAAALSAVARTPVETIHFGVIPTVAPYGLPGLLAKLREKFPERTFVLRELQTSALLDGLRHGDLDIGLLARPFDARLLYGPDLVEEPFVLAAPEGHPLAHPASVSLASLADAPLILMEEGHCLRTQALDLCATIGTPPAATAAAASVSTLARMVESGLGATLLPATSLRTEVHPNTGIVARAFEGVLPSRTLTLQWRPGSPHHGWFLEVARILRQHYLDLNETVPSVHGGAPRIVAADGK